MFFFFVILRRASNGLGNGLYFVFVFVLSLYFFFVILRRAANGLGRSHYSCLKFVFVLSLSLYCTERQMVEVGIWVSGWCGNLHGRKKDGYGNPELQV